MVIHKLPISAVMVIYNEEAVLERALESLADLVDEIIIVHDGPCKDKSLQIATKYKAKIYVRKHVGICEPHRPLTYKKAKNDWILQIDADEYLSEGLRNNLGKLINTKVDIYDFSWPGFYKNRHYIGPYKRALFKKSKIVYFGLRHHDPVPLNKDVVVKKSNYRVIHKPNYEYLELKSFCL